MRHSVLAPRSRAAPGPLRRRWSGAALALAALCAVLRAPGAAAAAPAGPGAAPGLTLDAASGSELRFQAAAAVAMPQGKLTTCKNCIYVIERIKQGYQNLLPSICVEIFTKTEGSQADYTVCQNVLAALTVHGAEVERWIKTGCFKAEPYGAQEVITPCPSHIICNHLRGLEGGNFCPAPKSDFAD